MPKKTKGKVLPRILVRVSILHTDGTVNEMVSVDEHGEVRSTRGWIRFKFDPLPDDWLEWNQYRHAAALFAALSDIEEKEQEASGGGDGQDPSSSGEAKSE